MMEFRDVLKQVRGELGFTQTDLATILKVNYATISRWELGKTYPSRSLSEALIQYVRNHSVSERCCKNLEEALSNIRKAKFSKKNNELYTVEHETLSSMIENAFFPVYVSDIDTFELLYCNKKAALMLREPFEKNVGEKCYECFWHRDEPCPFCHKEELDEGDYKGFDMYRSISGSFHRIYGKQVMWNGRRAQIRYLQDVSGVVSVSAQKERATAYFENLRIRKETATDALVTAFFNLTKNTVTDIESMDESWKHIVETENIDGILGRISENSFDEENENAFALIKNRESLIQAYYIGKTHISIQHYMKGSQKFYQGTFDLMQNPVTYDVEMFASLRDITEDTIAHKILNVLYSVDYESILTIDAKTGQANSYFGEHIDDVIKEQKRQKNNIEGVEQYLRKHCINNDVERVILETSLPYVKRQLRIMDVHTSFYSLKIDGKALHKKVIFTYLDRTKRLILCAMQNITEILNEEITKKRRLYDAVCTLRDMSGMNIATYDLVTRDLFGDFSITSELGYGPVIPNVPDTFIEDGNVAPESIRSFRDAFARIRIGENLAFSPYLRIPTGEFHLFKVNSKIVFDEEKKAEQAIIVFQDIEEFRNETISYKKLKEMVKEQNPGRYVIYRCNLSKEAHLSRTEGKLLCPNELDRFEELISRTEQYVKKCVHEDDVASYQELMNRDALLAAYAHGIREAKIDYREKAEEGKYRWVHLCLEMAQYPDSEDIELLLLYQLDD